MSTIDLPNHRLRDDPYPDELDQAFCEIDQTLCMDDRPCLCCYVDKLERLTSETVTPAESRESESQENIPHRANADKTAAAHGTNPFRMRGRRGSGL